jgi:hypothetical protein
MELRVLRYRSMADETLSVCFDDSGGERHFLCYGLEDEFRTNKVWGETRIPAGRYKMELRTKGKHHTRYSDKFPSIHKGMIWLRDPSQPDNEVPNFKYILWHIGNDDDDTAGCYLLGTVPTERGTVDASTRAYKRVYSHVIAAMDAGEEVWVTYEDYDTPPAPRSS